MIEDRPLNEGIEGARSMTDLNAYGKLGSDLDN